MASDRPLTPLQQRFVGEYLVDLNATQAAIRAGYSAATADKKGPALVGDSRIAAAIAERQQARAERVELTQDYVVGTLLEVVERCMQRAPVMVRRGKEVVQLVDEDDRHVWSFDAKGANTALGLLGKHLGMFVEKHELTGKDGAPLPCVLMPPLGETS